MAVFFFHLVFSPASAEHRTNEEFMRVNPHKKVPAIDDNGFTLSERLVENPTSSPVNFFLLYNYSSAILRYLVTKYKLPDHWYPADVAKRARVDEYLSWHCSNLRIGAAELIFSKVAIRMVILKVITFCF